MSVGTHIAHVAHVAGQTDRFTEQNGPLYFAIRPRSRRTHAPLATNGPLYWFLAGVNGKLAGGLLGFPFMVTSVSGRELCDLQYEKSYLPI